NKPAPRGTAARRAVPHSAGGPDGADGAGGEAGMEEWSVEVTVSLFWRVFLLNALVLATAAGVLLLTPVSVSVPVLLTEAVAISGGLIAMLLANALLL